MPAVSVIITTYNRPEYLRKAIESVLVQTYQDWELVIVDDGSTDNTQEVVRKYVNENAKVRYVRQTNQGPGPARNKGISETSGAFIAFLDDDDWWLPEKLETQVAFMKTHPEVGLSYTRLRIFRSINGRLDDSTVVPVRMATTLEEMLDKSFIPSSTVILRRECLAQISPFKADAASQEDMELWLRFVQRWKIAALEVPLTEMKKTDRPQLSANIILSLKKAIEIVSQLELLPEFQHLRSLKVKHSAKLHYKIGRTYMDEHQYLHAAKHFSLALLHYPLVGLMVRRPEERGLRLLVRLTKSYMAVPICLVKGIIHGQR